MYDRIPTPAVVIELDQVEDNLKQMVKANEAWGIHVRPHIKPHKSVYLAKLQLELGAKGITCAKIGEAEVMAEHGITDILIAYPLIGKDKMERLGKLMKKASIITVVNSETGARQLSECGEANETRIKVLIEVDGGTHRGGVAPYEAAVAFAEKISGLGGIDLCGLMYYGGTIYGEENKEGFIRAAQKEHKEIAVTAEMLEKKGFPMNILSGGNSYSARNPEYLKGITEVRCGNYIFDDCLTIAKGYATERECALRVVSTVIALADKNHAIIDAGSKTLTTDLCDGRTGYGIVAGRPDIMIDKLNEEHGFISSENPLKLEIGDKIAVIPNHACVIPNLTDEMYGIRAGAIERMVAVEARGKNR